MTPAPEGSDLDPEVRAALRRIAGASARATVAPDGDGLARAAMTEAGTIRRQRRLVGLVAAAAAVAAIALPVALRASTRAPFPAAAVATSASRTVDPAPGSTARVRVSAGRPAPLSGAQPPGPDAVVRPYVVDGTYHGQSGTLRLGSAADLRGLVDVLSLAGGARVLRFEPSGGVASMVVQSADGGQILRLAGVSGPTVADASGKRFALLDTAAARLTLRDERGKVLEQTSAPGIRSMAGFAGGRVLVANDQGSAMWDPVAGTIEPWASEGAIDATDTASTALLVTRAGSGAFCWRVRSSAKNASVQSAPRCGPAAPVALTADGRYVLTQLTPPTGPARVDVLDALTGESVLAVTLDEGTTVTQLGFRLGRAELVMGVVTPSGGNRLVGCTLDGRCHSLTPTMTKATPASPEPYLLVRD